MSDGLNTNYSVNNYEDSLSDYPINSPLDRENSTFSQVKSVVKGTIINPQMEVLNQEVKSRFISSRGILNNKLKNIFHKAGTSVNEENEIKEEHLEKEEKPEEEDSSNEKEGLNLESDIESFSEAANSEAANVKESGDIDKKSELEKKDKPEVKEEKSLSEVKELKGTDSREGNQENSVEEKNFQSESEIKESNDQIENNLINEGEDKESFEPSDEKMTSENLSEEKEATLLDTKEEGIDLKNDNDKDIENKENQEQEEVKNEEDLEEEVRLTEDSQGDSISEIEQMEIQREEKKEEHEEGREEKEIEGKEEDKNLLPGVDAINSLENKNDKEEEIENEDKNKKDTEKNKSTSIEIPLDLISFIKKNISKILSHKSYSINNYNCFFYAEDVAVFFLKEFSNIMVTIFRSSVSAIEAEKIYQIRQKARKFIQENNLSFLQVSEDKLLVMNSSYGPIKVLLEKRLSSGFILSDLVGHKNYKMNKYSLKEALQQFVIFMCDFGLTSGFRYKLRILPNKIPKPSSIALYCSYSISLANNFKLFKETISILNKNDFDFIFNIIENKLDKNKASKIFNYWKLKQ